MFTWREAEPGGKLPTVFEHPGIAYSGDDGRSGKRPNTMDALQALYARILSVECAAAAVPRRQARLNADVNVSF